MTTMKSILLALAILGSIAFLVFTAWLRLSGRISSLEWLALDAAFGAVVLLVSWLMVRTAKRW